MSDKICFTASSGGHMMELLRLLPRMRQYDQIVITEKSCADLSMCKKVYYMEQVNRKRLRYIIAYLFSFFRVWKILKVEKPSCIVSLGAMSTLPVCLIGRWMGIKVIYVESFARVNTLSVSGRLLYKKADLFIVQWESLAEKYANAIYGGGLL